MKALLQLPNAAKAATPPKEDYEYIPPSKPSRTQLWEQAADYLFLFETAEDPNAFFDVDFAELKALCQAIPQAATKLRDAYRAFRDRLRTAKAEPRLAAATKSYECSGSIPLLKVDGTSISSSRGTAEQCAGANAVTRVAMLRHDRATYYPSIQLGLHAYSVCVSANEAYRRIQRGDRWGAGSRCALAYAGTYAQANVVWPFK